MTLFFRGLRSRFLEFFFFVIVLYSPDFIYCCLVFLGCSLIVEVSSLGCDLSRLAVFGARDSFFFRDLFVLWLFIIGSNFLMYLPLIVI